MGVKPLAIAIAATALLLVVIGVDVSLTRTLAVDVHTGAAWRSLVEDPMPREDYARYYPYGVNPVEVNRTDAVRFRVRVENEYPWSFARSYHIYQGGDEVASGELTAPGRSNGTAEFTISADRLLGAPGVRYEPSIKEYPTVTAELRVEIGKTTLYANPSLKEVPK